MFINVFRIVCENRWYKHAYIYIKFDMFVTVDLKDYSVHTT